MLIMTIVLTGFILCCILALIDHSRQIHKLDNMVKFADYLAHTPVSEIDPAAAFFMAQWSKESKGHEKN